jgi:hypothetical protein
MIKEPLEQLFEYVAQHIPSEQIMLAKQEYQKTTGGIYEDDKSYNSRMALFLEWYLLDQYAPGTHKTVLENIIEENPSSLAQEHLELYKDITNNILAIFEVKKVRDHSVIVLDLFTDEKYQVDEEDSKLVFRKNDLLQGRIIPHQEKYYFSGHFCFHPVKTQRYLKSEAKNIYLIRKIWIKELNQLEKDLLKVQKSQIKNSKLIEKVKAKIGRTDISARLEHLRNELSELEQKKEQIIEGIQQIEVGIRHLKVDKMMLEGRRLTSELINKFAYMNLKWERSRQIDITDIYKNNA